MDMFSPNVFLDAMCLAVVILGGIYVVADAVSGQSGG